MDQSWDLSNGIFSESATSTARGGVGIWPVTSSFVRNSSSLFTLTFFAFAAELFGTTYDAFLSSATRYALATVGRVSFAALRRNLLTQIP